MAAQAAMLAAAMGLWLLTHRYQGIWHDARVYTLMAVHWLDPALLAREVWFAYGSQDRFSLFSPLYGTAIGVVGIPRAALLLTLAGGAAFVTGAWCLVRAARLGWAALPALLLLASVHLAYAPDAKGILHVSEQFVSARALAFALSLAALAFALRRRAVAAAMLHGGSLAIHPLVGIWAVALHLAVRLPERLVLAAWAAVMVLCGLAAARGWGPFAPMTGEFALLVHETARIVYLDSPHFDPTLALAVLFVNLLGGRLGAPRLRRWYLMAALIGGSGLLLALLASQHAPAKLLLQAQVWRALWPAMVLAVLAVADVARRHDRLAAPERCAALGGLVALLFVDSGGAEALLALYLALRTGVLAFAVRRLAPAQATLRRVLAVALPVLGAVWLALYVDRVTALGAAVLVPAAEIGPVRDFLRGFLLSGGFGGLALLVWAIWRLAPGGARVLPLLLLAAGAATWDGRRPMVQALEAGFTMRQHESMFGGRIGRGDVVYWQRASERVWWELGAASYASGVQAIGIVFSEPFALELQRRLYRTALAAQPKEFIESHGLSATAKAELALQAAGVGTRHDLHRVESSGLSRSGLYYLCADPALDWVVHPRHFADLAVATGADPLHRRSQVALSLYDCRRLRKPMPQPVQGTRAAAS